MTTESMEGKSFQALIAEAKKLDSQAINYDMTNYAETNTSLINAMAKMLAANNRELIRSMNLNLLDESDEEKRTQLFQNYNQAISALSDNIILIIVNTATEKDSEGLLKTALMVDRLLHLANESLARGDYQSFIAITGAFADKRVEKLLKAAPLADSTALLLNKFSKMQEQLTANSFAQLNYLQKNWGKDVTFVATHIDTKATDTWAMAKQQGAYKSNKKKYDTAKAEYDSLLKAYLEKSSIIEGVTIEDIQERLRKPDVSQVQLQLSEDKYTKAIDAYQLKLNEYKEQISRDQDLLLEPPPLPSPPMPDGIQAIRKILASYINQLGTNSEDAQLSKLYDLNVNAPDAIRQLDEVDSVIQKIDKAKKLINDELNVEEKETRDELEDLLKIGYQLKVVNPISIHESITSQHSEREAETIAKINELQDLKKKQDAEKVKRLDMILRDAGTSDMTYIKDQKAQKSNYLKNNTDTVKEISQILISKSRQVTKESLEQHETEPAEKYYNQLKVSALVDIRTGPNILRSAYKAERWLHVASQCLAEGDFQSVIAIMDVLNIPEITKLNLINRLSPDSQKLFNQLQQVYKLSNDESRKEEFAELRAKWGSQTTTSITDLQNHLDAPGSEHWQNSLLFDEKISSAMMLQVVTDEGFRTTIESSRKELDKISAEQGEYKKMKVSNTLAEEAVLKENATLESLNKSMASLANLTSRDNVRPLSPSSSTKKTDAREQLAKTKGSDDSRKSRGFFDILRQTFSSSNKPDPRKLRSTTSVKTPPPLNQTSPAKLSTTTVAQQDKKIVAPDYLMKVLNESQNNSDIASGLTNHSKNLFEKITAEDISEKTRKKDAKRESISAIANYTNDLFSLVNDSISYKTKGDERDAEAAKWLAIADGARNKGDIATYVAICNGVKSNRASFEAETLKRSMKELEIELSSDGQYKNLREMENSLLAAGKAVIPFVMTLTLGMANDPKQAEANVLRFEKFKASLESPHELSSQAMTDSTSLSENESDLSIGSSTSSQDHSSQELKQIPKEGVKGQGDLMPDISRPLDDVKLDVFNTALSSGPSSAPLPTKEDLKKLKKEIEVKVNNYLDSKVKEILALQETDPNAAAKMTRDLLAHHRTIPDAPGANSRREFARHPEYLHQLIQKGSNEVLAGINNSKIFASHYWKDTSEQEILSQTLTDIINLSQQQSRDDSKATLEQALDDEGFVDMPSVNDSAQELIDSMRELFGKQITVDTQNTSKYRDKLVSMQGRMACELFHLLNGHVDFLNAKGTLPKYDDKIFDQSLSNTIRLISNDKIVNPLEFKSNYRELLRCFEKIPGFNGMENKVEVMFIMHNLMQLTDGFYRLNDINQKILLGSKDPGHFMRQVPAQFENIKDARAKLDDISFSINDEIKRLEQMKKAMSGSNNEVRTEIKRVPDFEKRAEAFNAVIDKRIAGLDVARKNIEGIKQQASYMAKQNPKEPIQIADEKKESPKTPIPPSPSSAPRHSGPG